MKAIPRLFLQSLAAAFLVAPSLSAPQDQEALKQKYQDKLSHEFVSFGGWITDYDAARAKAKADGKPLFVYFSRSYAP